MDRILVAASQEGRDRLRPILEGKPAHFTTSYAGGVEALLRNEYELVWWTLLRGAQQIARSGREQPSRT